MQWNKCNAVLSIASAAGCNLGIFFYGLLWSFCAFAVFHYIIKTLIWKGSFLVNTDDKYLAGEYKNINCKVSTSSWPELPYKGILLNRILSICVYFPPHWPSLDECNPVTSDWIVSNMSKYNMTPISPPQWIIVSWLSYRYHVFCHITIVSVDPDKSDFVHIEPW